jgi:hypothetical protein
VSGPFSAFWTLRWFWCFQTPVHSEAAEQTEIVN